MKILKFCLGLGLLEYDLKSALTCSYADTSIDIHIALHS
ncbi:MAG: hypothetical protein RLZZ215_1420 [Pseudomonadota bacterium]|jgi:hypothetical protein